LRPNGSPVEFQVEVKVGEKNSMSKEGGVWRREAIKDRVIKKLN
jgi:hypothetical protein